MEGNEKFKDDNIYPALNCYSNAVSKLDNYYAQISTSSSFEKDCINDNESNDNESNSEVKIIDNNNNG